MNFISFRAPNFLTVIATIERAEWLPVSSNLQRLENITTAICLHVMARRAIREFMRPWLARGLF